MEIMYSKTVLIPFNNAFRPSDFFFIFLTIPLNFKLQFYASIWKSNKLIPKLLLSEPKILDITIFQQMHQMLIAVPEIKEFNIKRPTAIFQTFLPSDIILDNNLKVKP